MMKSYRLKYFYSYAVLIFFALVFFPIALMLLLTGSSFESHESSYAVRYRGSRFWLGFWTLVFFPIAFLLLFLNGIYIEQRGSIELCA